MLTEKISAEPNLVKEPAKTVKSDTFLDEVNGVLGEDAGDSFGIPEN